MRHADNRTGILRKALPQAATVPRGSLATLMALATLTVVASGCGSSGHRAAVERCVERWNTEINAPHMDGLRWLPRGTIPFTRVHVGTVGASCVVVLSDTQADPQDADTWLTTAGPRPPSNATDFDVVEAVKPRPSLMNARVDSHFRLTLGERADSPACVRVGHHVSCRGTGR